MTNTVNKDFNSGLKSCCAQSGAQVRHTPCARTFAPSLRTCVLLWHSPPHAHVHSSSSLQCQNRQLLTVMANADRFAPWRTQWIKTLIQGLNLVALRAAHRSAQELLLLPCVLAFCFDILLHMRTCTPVAPCSLKIWDYIISDIACDIALGYRNAISSYDIVCYIACDIFKISHWRYCISYYAISHAISHAIIHCDIA